MGPYPVIYPSPSIKSFSFLQLLRKSAESGTYYEILAIEENPK
jgi:hypothetical protein